MTGYFTCSAASHGFYLQQGGKGLPVVIGYETEQDAGGKATELIIGSALTVFPFTSTCVEFRAVT